MCYKNCRMNENMKANCFLRTGITTGACSQAAAKASAVMLTAGKVIDRIEIELPNGETRTVSLIKQELKGKYVRCSVIKDSGEEDKDVTNGIEIVCKIQEKEGAGIELKGGRGVGRVTRPGLAVEVGEYAINPVPRQMIIRDVTGILPRERGFVVEISVPEGERIAKQTYNPRLGVEGGISIIGTTGIVKPKSRESYKKSLIVELNVAKAAGYKTIFIASGYLGERLLTGHFGIAEQQIIKVGDHVGFMLEQCLNKGIKKTMVIGHIGKLAKVAAGLFNTHSKTGDARMETIAAYAAANGADRELVRKILNLELAEAAIDLLKKNSITGVFDDIAGRVTERCLQYCRNKLEVAAVILSLKGEVIGKYPKDIFNSIPGKYKTLS